MSKTNEARCKAAAQSLFYVVIVGKSCMMESECMKIARVNVDYHGLPREVGADAADDVVAVRF
jgi:hypothetical protein